LLKAGRAIAAGAELIRGEYFHCERGVCDIATDSARERLKAGSAGHLRAFERTAGMSIPEVDI
jgi:hypothetical protein